MTPRCLKEESDWRVLSHVLLQVICSIKLHICALHILGTQHAP